jgi:hypothetical protein
MSTVLTGAIALIKVGGEVIGRMKSVRCQESFRRQPIKGIGTIMPSEEAVTDWEGTLSCDFMEIRFEETGIKNAIRRKFANSRSQVTSGDISFEDQLLLDVDGVQIDILKKVTDVVNPDGTIKPKLEPYAVVKRCLIESDSFDISEGAVAGHSQSFKYLDPIVF